VKQWVKPFKQLSFATPTQPLTTLALTLTPVFLT